MRDPFPNHKLDPTLRDIARSILIHEECMSLKMVKQFLTWVELGETSFSLHVLQQRVLLPKEVARILKWIEKRSLA